MLDHAAHYFGRGTWYFNDRRESETCTSTSPIHPLDLTAVNQVRVVAFSLPQLTQASFLQKNQMLQNRFLISVTLRWHKVSVACKNQSFKS